MVIVVTGAAGFIGSNLVKALNERGETDILAVDDLKQGDKFAQSRRLRDRRLPRQGRVHASASRTASSTARSTPCSHQGACSDTTETDGRYMMETNYRYSTALLDFCIERRGAVHLRLVRRGLRRGPRVPRGARVRGAAQRLRLFQVPVRPAGAAAPRGAHRADRRACAISTSTASARATRGAWPRSPAISSTSTAADGQRAALRRQRRLRRRRAAARFRVGRGLRQGQPVLSRPSRDAPASSTSAPAPRRASTTWRSPRSTPAARRGRAPAHARRDARGRASIRVHPVPRGPRRASTRATPRRISRALARRGLRRAVPDGGAGRRLRPSDSTTAART